MPKEEWGTKRICPTTGKRFYDLNKTPIVSPYTGEVIDLEALRRKSAVMSPARVAAAAPKGKDILTEDTEVEVEVDDDLLETEVVEDDDLDDDLLEDDEDDTVSLDDLADVGGNDDDV